MSSAHQNLSAKGPRPVPDASELHFGIVVSEWNAEVTEAMKIGAVNTLIQNGALRENIQIVHVPGSFELTLGAQFFAEETEVDAVICLGCVIRGETKHFDFICDAVANGITNLNIKYNIPVVFGVLTTENMKQALDRCGGKYGNKGDEAAVTAIKMSTLKRAFIR